MANFLIVTSVAIASAVVAVGLDIGAFWLIGGAFVNGKGPEAALAWLQVFLASLAISLALGLGFGAYVGVKLVQSPEFPHGGKRP